MLPELIDFILLWLWVRNCVFHAGLLLKLMEITVDVIFLCLVIVDTFLPILVLVLIFVSPPLSPFPSFRFGLICALLSFILWASWGVVDSLRTLSAILVFLIRTGASPSGCLLIVLSLASDHGLLNVERTLYINILFFLNLIYQTSHSDLIEVRGGRSKRADKLL